METPDDPAQSRRFATHLAFGGEFFLELVLLLLHRLGGRLFGAFAFLSLVFLAHADVDGRESD